MKKYLFYIASTIFITLLFSIKSAMADIPVQVIPTLNQWGMIGMALVLFLVGLYILLKKA
jgi:cadmium resistance protein CadD (predicted permease)